MPVRISVIVPTHNRRDLLLRLVGSLLRQTLSAEQYEIIVVCDGTTDGTAQALTDLRAGFPQLRLVEQPQRGPAAARNAGARAARGTFLAFTDDDCTASSDWLEQILLTFDATAAVAVQGQTTTDRLLRTPLTHQIEVLSAWTSAMQTCNASYLRSVFEAVGGFDESFKFAHDEDRDLAWRAEDLGKIVFSPAVHVVHPPRHDPFLKHARWVRGLESDFLLFSKSPEKYRRYVSRSPWWTIYWKVFVVAQLRMIKSSCKYLLKPFRPDYFFIGLGLVWARWFNLICFFPSYYKAQTFYRGTARLKQPTGSPLDQCVPTAASADPLAGGRAAKSPE